jgi:hypothetical protein
LSPERTAGTIAALGRLGRDLEPVLGEDALLDAQVERGDVEDRDHPDGDLLQLGAGGAGRCRGVAAVVVTAAGRQGGGGEQGHDDRQAKAASDRRGLAHGSSRGGVGASNGIGTVWA